MLMNITRSGSTKRLKKFPASTVPWLSCASGGRRVVRNLSPTPSDWPRPETRDSLTGSNSCHHSQFHVSLKPGVLPHQAQPRARSIQRRKHRCRCQPNPLHSGDSTSGTITLSVTTRIDVSALRQLDIKLFKAQGVGAATPDLQVAGSCSVGGVTARLQPRLAAAALARPAIMTHRHRRKILIARQLG